MSELNKLQPPNVWNFFEQITRIPRPSGREEKIVRFLETFARERNLAYRVDGTGNIVILKPASEGMESAPAVVLQNHVDMVCEKNGDVRFDFFEDPIRPYVSGGWVRAEGTTLGADCGIGMAAALAVLDARDLVHGPLEALFTIDEERGLTGAFGLEEGMITGKYLLNLDSEDEGEIFIGCAGGIDTTAQFRYVPEALPDGYLFYRLSLTGLTGGHSGDDIHKGLGNSVKLLTRFLWRASRRYGLRLARMEGGNLRNAIPREASAVFAVPAEAAEELTGFFDRFVRAVSAEYAATEKGMRWSLDRTGGCPVTDRTAQTGLLGALRCVADGVLAMSRTMDNLVETSTNLASVRFAEGNRIIVTTSQRSSSESAKTDAVETVESAFLLGGASVAHSEGYPGWTPDPSSRLLRVAEEQYRKKVGGQPKVRAIHAGLECGLFLKKFPWLEMVSIGPTIRGAHSPDERLEIDTVDKFWRLLTGILAELRE